MKVFIWQSQTTERHCTVNSKPRYYLLPFGKFNTVLVICFLVFHLLSRGSFCHLENTSVGVSQAQIHFSHQTEL